MPDVQEGVAAEETRWGPTHVQDVQQGSECTSLGHTDPDAAPVPSADEADDTTDLVSAAP